MSDTDVTQIQGPRELFSIRSQLAQQANPLRAKMVLFSVLYRPFAYSSGDWSTLKQQDLGEFIRRVYNKYATLEELKASLMLVTAQLDKPVDCDRAAAAILKVLKPYYAEVEPVTGDLTDFGEDLDASQTWDIPIGVSLKDSNKELNAAQTGMPVMGRDSNGDLSDLPTTGLSSATTAAIFDSTVDPDNPEMDSVDDSDHFNHFNNSDNSNNFGGFEDFEDSENSGDNSSSDHSRWLDSFDGNDLKSQNTPTGNPKESDTPEAPEEPEKPEKPEEPEASEEPEKPEELEASEEPEKPEKPEEPEKPEASENLEEPEPVIRPESGLPIAPSQTSDREHREHREHILEPAQNHETVPKTDPNPANTKSQRKGRRTSLAQVLTQHVSSRKEVDAIVQRYSKTLTEQVTSALDDLEDELAECLVDRDAKEATQIAGEALGRVLLSVSDSIEQMRQALESIPGVDPISASSDRLQTQRPQRSNFPIPGDPTSGDPTSDDPTSSPTATEPQEVEDFRLPIVSTQPNEISQTSEASNATNASETSKDSQTSNASQTLQTPKTSSKNSHTSQPKSPPTIDPVQQISDHFATLLAKRDMSILVKQRNGCVHLIAEASPLPEQSKLIRFITKNLKQLDLPPIPVLRLHGRRKDARAFDWSEDLPPIG